MVSSIKFYYKKFGYDAKIVFDSLYLSIYNGKIYQIIIIGNTVGEALVQHPDTKIISFTGSTLIGKRIAGIAAPMMKRLRYVHNKNISYAMI